MADAKILGAVNAYSNAANINSTDYSFAKPSVNKEIKPDFTELVSQALGNAVDAQKTAEVESAKALVNKTTLDELAIAVNNADLALRTVVSIRDRVIAAYQDIIKMPI